MSPVSAIIGTTTIISEEACGSSTASFPGRSKMDTRDDDVPRECGHRNRHPDDGRASGRIVHAMASGGHSLPEGADGLGVSTCQSNGSVALGAPPPAFRDIWTVRAAATNPSLRSLAVIENMVTGCLTGMLHFVRATRCPFHFARPVGDEDVLARCLHHVLRFILAAVDDSSTSHIPATVHAAATLASRRLSVAIRNC
jgi:hypothetical protein